MLILVEEIPSSSHRQTPVGHSPTPARSPSPDEFLPKVACCVTVRKNGRSVGSPKQFQLDVNVEYDMFKHKLYDTIHKKAAIEYDAFGFHENISLKYAWTQKKRVMANNPKQKPLSANEFTDLDDESDYDALQQEVRATSHRRKSGETIDDMVLSIHASVVLESTASNHFVGHNEADDFDGPEGNGRAVIVP